MSDDHSDVGAGEERKADPGNVTDDGEVELNLPREVMEEQDRPREDIREYPGATASGTTAMSQEERHAGVSGFFTPTQTDDIHVY